MKARRRPALVGMLALWSVLAVGCTPLYLPPVPPEVAGTPVTSLGDASSLTVVDGSLRLHLIVSGVNGDGWLAVQWYGPRGVEVASDSVWVDPSDVGTGRTFYLPPTIEVAAGEWRAVASFHGRVVRQFRATVPAAAGTTEP